MKNKILDSFNPDEFIDLINEYGEYKRNEIFQGMNLFSTKHYGIDFSDLWEDLKSIEEKIELISELSYFFRETSFFKQPQFVSFFNKIDHYLLESSYKWITIMHKGRKVEKLVKEEVGEVLEVINNKNISFYVHTIMNSNDYKDAEKNFFILQKDFYEEFKKLPKLQKGSNFGVINFEMLSRKIEAYVRHKNEHNDKELRNFYKKLSNDEKLKAIQQLVVEYLIAIYLINNKNKSSS